MADSDRIRTLRLALRVRDLDRTIRFYRELGLTIRRRAPRCAEFLLGDHVMLEVEQSDAAVNDPRLEVRVETEDPSGVLTRARRVGPTREIRGDGFSVVDPDGITVRVGRSADSKLVDEASEESFPASDPPSFMP